MTVQRICPSISPNHLRHRRHSLYFCSLSSHRIGSLWIAVDRCGSPWIAVDRIVTLTFLPDFFSDAAFEKRSCIFCVPLVPLGRESANCCCCLGWKLELELELRRTLQMAMGKGRRGMGKGMDWQPFVKSFRQRILSASSLYP